MLTERSFGLDRKTTKSVHESLHTSSPDAFSANDDAMTRDTITDQGGILILKSIVEGGDGEVSGIIRER